MKKFTHWFFALLLLVGWQTSQAQLSCRYMQGYLQNSSPVTLRATDFVVNPVAGGNYTFSIRQRGELVGTPFAAIDTLEPCSLMTADIDVHYTNPNGVLYTCTTSATLQDTQNICALQVNCAPLTASIQSDGDTIISAFQLISSVLLGGQIQVPRSDVEFGASFSYGIYGVTDSTRTFTCSQLGVHPITVYYYHYMNGRSDSCQTTLTITDPNSYCNPPVTCQNRTVYLTPNLVATVTPQMLVTNYDTAANYTLSLGSNAGASSLQLGCSNIGTNTITITKLLNGTRQLCTSTVTVADTGNYCTPRVSCQPMTVTLSSTAATSIYYRRFVSSSAPYNGSISVAINGVTDTLFYVGCTAALGVGTHQVVVTNTANGQVARCTTSLTVTAPTGVCYPTLACQSRTVYLTPNLVASVTPQQLVSNYDTTFTYWISNRTTSGQNSTLSYNCSSIGRDTVTIVRRDPYGNLQSCMTTVTVADTGNYCTPRISCQPMTVALSSAAPSSIHFRRFVASSAPYNSSISVAINGVTDTLFYVGCTTALGVGTHQVVVTNTANGQVARCTTSLTVIDSNNYCNPLVCQNRTVYLTPNLAATVTPAMVVSNTSANATYTLALTGTTISGSMLQLGCANVGANNITVSRTLNGTTQTCAATVTVVDSGSYCTPRVSCQPMTVALSSAAATSVHYGRFVTSFAPYNSSISVAINGVTDTLFYVGCTTALGVGTHQVVVTNTANGQVARCTTSLTVIDSNNYCNPLVCQNRTVYLTPNLATTVTPAMLVSNYDTTANYAISFGSVITPFNLQFGCVNIGTNNVTVRRTLNGTTQTCTAIVTVADTGNYCAPRVSCQPMTVTLSSVAATSVHYRRFVTSFAPYNGSISVAINGVTDTLFYVGCTTALGVGTHQVVVTNTANGQIARCTTSLTVTDPNNVCTPTGLTCRGVVANITPNMVVVVNANQFVTTPLASGYYLFAVDTMSATTNHIFNCSQIGTHNIIVTQRANNQILTCTTTVTITDTNHVCQTTVPCVNTALIDSSYACAYTYAPVCGCDSVTYRNACIAQHWYGVTSWRAGACPSRTPIQIAPAVQPHDCNNTSSCTGSIQLNITGGVAPYSARWSDISTTTSLTRSNICPSTYTVTITDAAGSTAISNVIVGYSRGCVWPGDTDDDAHVSYFDVLPIALTHGESGGMRPNASLNWTAQPCADWTTVHPIAGLPNYKHIDADGNGVINQLDMQAVINNYNRSYYRTNSVEGNIPFYIESIITQEGARLSLPIVLGTNSVIADNVYGVAFTIEYDPAMVDAGSLSVDFTNSWLGSDLLTFYNEDASTGRLEVVAARKDRLNVTNFGTIGSLNMTIRDDILRAGTRIMDLNISNVRLIDNANAIIGTMRPTGTVTVDLAQSVETAANAKLTVFPNPAEDIINVQLREANAQQVRLYNVAGQLIHDIQTPTSSLIQLNTQDLPSGIYTVSVVTDKGVMTERVQIKR